MVGMHSVLRSFNDCGWPAFLCVLIGAVGLILGGVGALLGALKSHTSARVLGGMAVVLGLLAGCTGLVGKVRGESVVAEVTAGNNISPDQRERIRAEGMKEAAQCVTIGLGTAALPVVLGVLAVALGMGLQSPLVSG